MADSGSQTAEATLEPQRIIAPKRPLDLMLSPSVPDTPARTAARPSQRNKVSRACDACKKRKTRCSGELPCVRCHELSFRCQYTATYTRGRLPRIPAAPITSSGGLPTYHSSQFSPVTHSQTVLFQDELVPAIRDSSSNSPVPNTEIEGRYHGPSSPLTFLERAWKRLKKTHVSTFFDHLEPGASGSGSNPRRRSLSQAPSPTHAPQLPSQRRTEQLVETYFDVSTPFYRFLHRGVVDAWVKIAYQDAGGSLSTHGSSLASGELAVLLMIIAEASFYQEQKSEESIGESLNKSVEYHAYACECLQDDLRFPTLESVQARLVECYYLLSTAQANEVYSKFGMLVSMAVTIGLHRQKRRHGYKTEIGLLEQECRKRAFWATYILDRYLSVMAGRPRLLQDHDHDQDVPSILDDEALTTDGVGQRPKHSDSVMDAANAHAELACIIGQASHEIYALKYSTPEEKLDYVQRGNRAIAAWKRDLPVIFREVAPSSLSSLFRRQSILLNIGHAHAIIHANRPFLLSRLLNPNSDETHSEKCFEGCIRDCVAAARDVLKALDCFTDDDDIFQSSWFVQYVSFCAIAIIYIFVMLQRQQRSLQYTNPASSPSVFDATPSVPLDQDLSSAELWQHRLAKFAARHSPGKKHHTILEELRHEFFYGEESAQDEPSVSVASTGGCAQVQGIYSTPQPGFPYRENEDVGFSAELDMDWAQLFDCWGLPERMQSGFDTDPDPAEMNAGSSIQLI
ncbi:hypothetical protein N7510_000654 [Penicillium lagena]|uniref:uncharacterized protein n=1 Tax=Penicillium lagena TaxID=94218 RepID=UPI002541D984|nr:uncharacterized protein N7510_000654 [Penicillium lagena]KAJ5624345.1 hypothetical protein N7510_000654 [Penicillium lagena]